MLAALHPSDAEFPVLADGNLCSPPYVGDGFVSVQSYVISSSSKYSRTMLDQARLTAATIVNTRAARKESFLFCLPPSFSSTSKANLHGSVMDSEFLLEDSCGQGHSSG